MIESLLQRINLELFLYGFSIIRPSDNNFENLYLNDFQIEMRYLKASNSEENTTYHGGNILKLKLKDIINERKFKQYNQFNLSNKNILNSMNNMRGYKLDSIFRTFDTKETVHKAQQSHFDRIPTLKFMLYVNDINQSNGAFCLSPGSHNWVNYKYGKIRSLSQSNKYKETSRNIPKCIIDKMEPIEGKAGTLIIFHTNCVHNQGIVHEGSCKIIRAHYRKRFLKFNFA
tara:strand:+ start:1658 stop:2344 length:687 start_codon:yes stop_codon:yes gene_type:complete